MKQGVESPVSQSSKIGKPGLLVTIAALLLFSSLAGAAQAATASPYLSVSPTVAPGRHNGDQRAEPDSKHESDPGVEHR